MILFDEFVQRLKKDRMELLFELDGLFSDVIQDKNYSDFLEKSQFCFERSAKLKVIEKVLFLIEFEKSNMEDKSELLIDIRDLYKKMIVEQTLFPPFGTSPTYNIMYSYRLNAYSFIVHLIEQNY